MPRQAGAALLPALWRRRMSRCRQVRLQAASGHIASLLFAFVAASHIVMSRKTALQRRKRPIASLLPNKSCSARSALQGWAWGSLSTCAACQHGDRVWASCCLRSIQSKR